jgi:hypothetical protein
VLLKVIPVVMLAGLVALVGVPVLLVVALIIVAILVALEPVMEAKPIIIQLWVCQGSAFVQMHKKLTEQNWHNLR